MSVYICDVYNNLVWALTVWAVTLINEDRIGNIVHDNILEMHIRSTPKRARRPCFDSNTILCIAKGATNYFDSWNRLFILVPSKTSNANTVRNTGRLYCFLFMKEYTSVPYIGGISVQYKYKCGPKAYNIT